MVIAALVLGLMCLASAFAQEPGDPFGAPPAHTPAAESAGAPEVAATPTPQAPPPEAQPTPPPAQPTPPPAQTDPQPEGAGDTTPEAPPAADKPGPAPTTAAPVTPPAKKKPAAGKAAPPYVGRTYNTRGYGALSVYLPSEGNEAVVRGLLKQVKTIEPAAGKSGVYIVTFKSNDMHPETQMVLEALTNMGRIVPERIKGKSTGRFLVFSISATEMLEAGQRQAYQARKGVQALRANLQETNDMLTGENGLVNVIIPGMQNNIRDLTENQTGLVQQIEEIKKQVASSPGWWAMAVAVVALGLSLLALFRRGGAAAPRPALAPAPGARIPPPPPSSLSVQFRNLVDGEVVQGTVSIETGTRGGSGNITLLILETAAGEIHRGAFANVVDWDTAGVPNGPYNLMVYVEDDAGNDASASISIEVNN